MNEKGILDGRPGLFYCTPVVARLERDIVCIGVFWFHAGAIFVEMIL